MSRPGDVVWADGRSWVRRHNSFGGVKMWWMSEGSDAWGWHTLAYLRTLDDFAWLVRDGKRQAPCDDDLIGCCLTDGSGCGDAEELRAERDQVNREALVAAAEANADIARDAEADLIAAWLRRMALDPDNDTSTRTVLDIAASLVTLRAYREDR